MFYAVSRFIGSVYSTCRVFNKGVRAVIYVSIVLRMSCCVFGLDSARPAPHPSAAEVGDLGNIDGDSTGVAKVTQRHQGCNAGSDGSWPRVDGDLGIQPLIQ